ncbi:MAG TPA: HAMP domain-containing histidine kinase [bacterium (Candidatus Stahlbacteria)]|nr:HAMP domain-containing histidine kinase [Candidatus Stahlbacteria bacterium]
MIKRLLVPFLVFFLVTIIVVNIYLWRNYVLIRKELEHSLNGRLISIATAIATNIDNLRDLDERRPYFDQIIRSTGLFNLYIIDTGEKIVYQHKTTKFARGPDPILHLDRPAILSALAGEPEATPLYKVSNIYLKSGYVPIYDIYGEVIGAVGVAADAPSFLLLKDFENKGLILNLILICALILVSIGFIIILRRISRIEENIALDNTFTVLGQLAASVAHEIKNPLAIILTAADRLKRDPTSETIDYIKDEARRIDQIVRGYLSLGRRDLKDEVDINSIIEEVVESLAPRFEEKRIEVEKRLTRNLKSVVANPGSIRQIMINLITNSCEAIHDEGKILITTEEDGNLVKIGVSDTGTGIRKKDFKRLFSPFYTSKVGGSGIGLFVVRQTVETMKGRIFLTKKAGFNTTIMIEIPYGDSDR